MGLKFNIVYTPGTVHYLQLMLFSLLRWSGCSFRLVANGCGAEDVEKLQRLCHKSPRLECLALPSTTPLMYGPVLSYLQSVERSDHFCCMDSDILATGDFLGALAPHVGHYSGVFSASPIWLRDDERVLPELMPNLLGRFHRTVDGVCLGAMHWAIYDNRVLTRFIESSRIGFEERRWEDIPDKWQEQLASMGLQKRWYDTGKVLNVLLTAQGQQFSFVDSSFLQHLGGVGTGALGANRSRDEGALRRLRQITSRPVLAFKWRVRGLLGRQDPSRLALRVYAEQMSIQRRKRACVRYFTQLLRCVMDGLPMPTIPRMGDPGLEAKIQQVTKSILSLYQESREQCI